MHTEKFNLIKTCAVLFFLGRRIKRQTRRLNNILKKENLSGKRAVRAASALELSRITFDRYERKAIRLFLRFSVRQ